jgi:hypothetical protein
MQLPPLQKGGGGGFFHAAFPSDDESPLSPFILARGLLQRGERQAKGAPHFRLPVGFRVYSASSTRKENATMPAASPWAWAYSRASTWS